MNNRTLEHLFHKFSPLAFSVSLSVLHSREEAEDVVQDLFMNKVPDMIIKYPNATAEELGRIIARSAKNVSIDIFRRKKRYPEQQIFEHDAVTSLDEPAMDPDVATILQTLESQEQEVLTLKYLNKMTWAQIAVTIRLSEVGSRKRGRNALQKVRSLFFNGGQK